MKLIKYEGYNLTIEPYLLTLTVFKKLWNRDKSKTKERALLELAYIYFMYDFRSDYLMYMDLSERHNAIVLGEGIAESWLPDNVVKEAAEYYLKFKPTSAMLLEDTRAAIEKLRTLLRNIDLDERDEKGRPVYTLNTITATIKQIPSLVKDLDEAERLLAKELAHSDKVRGAQEKSMYEDL